MNATCLRSSRTRLIRSRRASGGIRFVEAVAEPEPELADESVDEPDAAAAVLRHSSESGSWPAPPVPDEISVPERLPSPPKRRIPPPTPGFGPVVVSHVSGRASEPEPQAVPAATGPALEPVHVQQDGWRVPALRNMKVFPSLANRVTINGVATREGELTKAQIPLRLEQIAADRRVIRDKITHLRATIDRRYELNRQTEAEERVQRALDRESEAAESRLAAVAPVLAGRPDGTTITELDAKVLIECGYERRSA